MIKTNGYYLDKPKYYEDFVTGGNIRNGFCHNAYRFFDNGYFFLGTKYNKSISVKFEEKDLNKLRSNKYVIENNKLKIILDYDKEWKHEQTLFIYSEDIICNDSKILTFKKWN